jgi:5-methylcytosine-specific restriction endonuclease McrA
MDKIGSDGLTKKQRFYLAHPGYNKAYYQEHKETWGPKTEEGRERRRANQGAWIAAHPDYQMAWREAHREQINEQHRALYAADPEKSVAKLERRRAMIAKVTNDLTDAQWEERVAEFNGYCAYCLQPMDAVSMDHMTPIVKGGGNTLSNVIPCCLSCNQKKHTRTLLEVVAGRKIFPTPYTRQQGDLT